MLSRQEPEERMTRGERVGVTVFGTVVFGLFLAELLQGFHMLKVGAVFLLVAWVGLLVLHEAGHAVVSALLGWRVCRVVIGLGKPMLRFRVAGVPVQLCRFPVGGYVIPAPRTLSGARWKSALVYLAGPGAELLLLALLVAVFGLDRLLERSTDLSIVAAQATAAAVIWGVAFNLFPMRTDSGGVTDGLGALLSPWFSDQRFASQQALPATTRAELCLLAGQRERAVAALDAGAREVEGNLPAQIRIAEMYNEAGAPERVVPLLQPLVEREDVPTTLQPSILSALSLALIRVAPERLDDAAAYAEFAFERDPQSIDVRIARAAVLIERARYHEAIECLQGIHATLLDHVTLDTRDAYLALAELRRGYVEGARRVVDALVQRGARGEPLERVRREVDARAPKMAESPGAAAADRND